jgi:RNA recognition motif-containing protein
MDDEGTKKKGRRRLRALFRAARSSLSLALNPPSSLSLSSLSLPQTGKRCFVGNLAWRTSWQDLKDKFREVGTVVYANVMRDDSGKL